MLRGKVAIAAMHALLFVIVVKLLHVSESFQVMGVMGGPPKDVGKLPEELQMDIAMANTYKYKTLGTAKKQELTKVQNELNEKVTIRKKYDAIVIATTRALDGAEMRVAQAVRAVERGAPSNIINQAEKSRTTVSNNLDAATKQRDDADTMVKKLSEMVKQLQLEEADLVKKVKMAEASENVATKIAKTAREHWNMTQKTSPGIPTSASAGSSILRGLLGGVQKTSPDIPTSASAGSSIIRGLLGAVGLESSSDKPINCPAGQYSFFYNGHNDGTGSSDYKAICMPCAVPYKPNNLIPSRYDTQNAQSNTASCLMTVAGLASLPVTNPNPSLPCKAACVAGRTNCSSGCCACDENGTPLGISVPSGLRWSLDNSYASTILEPK